MRRGRSEVRSQKLEGRLQRRGATAPRWPRPSLAHHGVGRGRFRQTRLLGFSRSYYLFTRVVCAATMSGHVGMVLTTCNRGHPTGRAEVGTAASIHFKRRQLMRIVLLTIAALLAPIWASAQHIDVIQFKLKEGCTLANYVTLKNDFNGQWGKSHGYIGNCFPASQQRSWFPLLDRADCECGGLWQGMGYLAQRTDRPHFGSL